MSDLKDELEQERREKEWAETWRPSEPGDALIGRLEGYDEATTDFGTYTVAHIRDEDGVLKGLWLMHSVLQDEWGEAAPDGAPQIGDRVGAMYHGQRSGDTYDYHMWTVKVERTDAPDEDRSPAEDDTAADEGDPAPQSRSAAPESGGEFDRGDLFGAPAEPAADGSNGPTLDDPNSELPF